MDLTHKHLYLNSRVNEAPNHCHSIQMYLYDWSMLKFPVAVHNIKKFEEVNNVSVNVYAVYYKDDSEVEEEVSAVSCEVSEDEENYSPPTKKQKGDDCSYSEKTKCTQDSRNVNVSRKRSYDVSVSGDESSDEGEDEATESDNEFIDDHLNEEEDASFYQALDNDMDDPPPTPKVYATVKERKGTIFPLRVADKVCETYDENGKLTENRHVNLLLTEKNGSYHYSTIANFSRLVNSQSSKHGHQKHFCYRCLQGFGRQELLAKHITLCGDVTARHVKMPTKGKNILKFTNIQKQLPNPIRVYADFECLLEEKDVETAEIGITEEGTSTSIKYQEHIPCSYGYYVVSDIPEFQPKFKSELRLDAPEVFLDEMQAIADDFITNHVFQPKRKPKVAELSSSQRHHYLHGDCHICEQPIYSGHHVPYIEQRVLDHDHFVKEEGNDFGKFRGPAHRHCNLQYRIKPEHYKVPVMFHNLRGYDSHILMKAIQKKHGSCSVVPNNMEKFMSVSVGQVRFIDSMQFMTSSLESLAANLSPEEMHHTHSQFPDEDHFKEANKKGVYPYDYFKTIDRFSETKIPDQKEFTNKLTGKVLSDEDFKRAHHIWELFSCESLEDYHNIYLKVDVVLLADVFEKFRKMCMETYKLDATHYFSAPGLAFDAALKMTG